MNTGAKAFVLLRANCRTNCYYDFNPCGIFEKMMSLSPIFNQELEQGKFLIRLIHGNKGKKNTPCNVSNRLKYGKITRKDLLCTKM